MFAVWPCPLPGGETAEENVRLFDAGRAQRLLVIPPLFDEHNKLRHQLVEVMRRLDMSDIDSFLFDLPGCNESTLLLSKQSLASWRNAVEAAISHFRATHVLAVRGGGLLVPDTISGWLYGPVAGKQLLRSMLRARVISSREAGTEESAETLSEIARSGGITLAGWTIGQDMFAELEASEKPVPENLVIIEQSSVGGSPLWLRAEPDYDAAQADALAALIADGILGTGPSE